MEVVLPSRGRWEDYRGLFKQRLAGAPTPVNLTPPPTPRAHPALSRAVQPPLRPPKQNPFCRKQPAVCQGAHP